MIKKFILSSFVLCFCLLAFPQEYACSIAYKHMSGFVGNDKIILDIQQSGNELNGSAVFPDRKFTEGSLEGLILTQRLEGTIDAHGIASIKAYSQNILLGEYSGMFSSVFKGTYRATASAASNSFNITEDCGEKNICFDGYCLDKDSVLLDTAGSPHAHLKLSLLLPKKVADGYELRTSVLTAFFGRKVNDSVPDDSLLYVYGKEYFRKYIEANRDLYDGGHSFNWEVIVISTVSLNQDGLLVYRVDNYGYTGGAHGMGISRFVVFDTEENQQLSLDNIFVDGYKDELSNMLERRYRESYYMEPEQSLTEAGLFENYIPPSENFFLTNNSIGFYYNPYKLAPYAMGGITISLLYEDMLPLFDINSPVMRLVR